MSIIPYTPPDFLKNQSTDEIYERMAQNASDIDTSQGSMFWDVCMPVAVEKAEMVNFILNETIKVCFPQWSYGIYLENHAQMVGIEGKKPPVKATGTLRITGIPGTVINQGFLFATPAAGGTASIEFATKNAAVIPENGILENLEIEAVNGGIQGNVAANTITMMVQPIKGIISITNPAPTSGGTEEESEDDLRQRILEASTTTPLSGSISDYIIWGKKVAGVGEVFVVPEWNGPGTVKLIVIDSNGQPANQMLINAVRDYIEPLRPIGAIVTVTAPVSRIIDYSLHLILTSEADLEEVIEKIKAGLQDYYKEVGVGGTIKYNRVAAIIANTQGVSDFSSLTINGQTSNIDLESDEYPATGTVTNT